MSPRDADVARPDASVIVVTHNNAPLIVDCLRAIKAGAGPRSYEVILVDNASTDGTLEAIPDELLPARTIALHENIGFAAANNAGIDASRGRMIVLVNSDAFPDPGSIDRLIAAIDGLPQAGIVGGRLRYPDGRLQPSHGTFPSLTGGAWVALFLHRLPILGRAGIGIAAHPALYKSSRRVDWVTAAFCVTRREIGHLPTGTFMYGEDVEWAFACRRRRWEVWFDPAATATHVGRASVDQSQDSGFAQRRRAQFELAWFARRGRLTLLAARGVLVAHALLRMALYRILATASGRPDRRASEYRVLLRAALDKRVRDR
jgi:GT2 family glycosyltransferase